jgi:hypothetical protein
MLFTDTYIYFESLPALVEKEPAHVNDCRLVVQDDERRESMLAELARARGSVLAKRE